MLSVLLGHVFVGSDRVFIHEKDHLNIGLCHCFIAFLASSPRNQHLEPDFQRLCAALHKYRTGSTAFPFNI